MGSHTIARSKAKEQVLKDDIQELMHQQHEPEVVEKMRRLNDLILRTYDTMERYRLEAALGLDQPQIGSLACCYRLTEKMLQLMPTKGPYIWDRGVSGRRIRTMPGAYGFFFWVSTIQWQDMRVVSPELDRSIYLIDGDLGDAEAPKERQSMSRLQEHYIPAGKPSLLVSTSGCFAFVSFYRPGDKHVEDGIPEVLLTFSNHGTPGDKR